MVSCLCVKRKPILPSQKKRKENPYYYTYIKKNVYVKKGKRITILQN